jgi:hypothetical protein
LLGVNLLVPAVSVLVVVGEEGFVMQPARESETSITSATTAATFLLILFALTYQPFQPIA